MNATVHTLISDTSENKQSIFITLDESNRDQNDLKVKKVLRQVNTAVSEKHKIQLEQFLSNPHAHPCIGIFIGDGELINLSSFQVNLDTNFEYKNFFILPFFDYRNVILSNTYFLIFSRGDAQLYSFANKKLVPEEIDLESFEHATKNRIENKSMQHHGKGETSMMHGQNATTEKDRESNLLDTYAGTLSEKLENFLESRHAQVMILSATENIDLIKNHIKESLLAQFHMEGNFENANHAELAEQIRNRLETHGEELLEESLKEIDISESNELGKKSFLEISAVVKKSRIESMFIGRLGMNDADYDNPVSPLGANYLASEVIELGGNIQYFPELDFSFSENNLAFKFRF